MQGPGYNAGNLYERIITSSLAGSSQAMISLIFGFGRDGK